MRQARKPHSPARCSSLCVRADNWVYAEGGGSFKQLTGVEGQRLSAKAFHPRGGEVAVTSDFEMATCPIWA